MAKIHRVKTGYRNLLHGSDFLCVLVMRRYYQNSCHMTQLSRHLTVEFLRAVRIRCDLVFSRRSDSGERRLGRERAHPFSW